MLTKISICGYNKAHILLSLTKDLHPQLMKKTNLSYVLREPRFPTEFQPEYIRLLERLVLSLRQCTSRVCVLRTKAAHT